MLRFIRPGVGTLAKAIACSLDVVVSGGARPSARGPLDASHGMVGHGPASARRALRLHAGLQPASLLLAFGLEIAQWLTCSA